MEVVATLTLAPVYPEEGLQPLAETPEPTQATAPAIGERVAAVFALAIVLAVPAIICVHTACANDGDIWWHLRTGQWIFFDHHALPTVDSFSASNAGEKPWQPL